LLGQPFDQSASAFDPLLASSLDARGRESESLAHPPPEFGLAQEGGVNFETRRQVPNAAFAVDDAEQDRTICRGRART
jgi:hypothetical protein